MNTLPKYIPPEAKTAMSKKLKVALTTYWVLLFLMLFCATAGIEGVKVGVLLLWFAVSVWLATVVADAASTSGGSAFIWGCGTLFLGPLGALVFPLAQLASLRK